MAYSAVTHPSNPIAYVAVANGVQPMPGAEIVTQGLGTELAVAGNGGASFQVPLEGAKAGKVDWSVDWLELDKGRGWRAQFSVAISDFPTGEFSAGATPISRGFEEQYDRKLPRYYHLLLRFDPDGALVVLTPGKAFIEGKLSGPAIWSDYIVLVQKCADRIQGLENLPPFVNIDERMAARLGDEPTAIYDPKDIKIHACR